MILKPERDRTRGELMPHCLCLSDHSIFASHDDFLLSCRHFLFKTGTGTTPLFSTATPGYTMASGSVYSPPTRPLPRNTLSRSAFKFKKSSKYCSWKCTALCAVGVSALLAILLSYFIGKSPFLELCRLYIGTSPDCSFGFMCLSGQGLYSEVIRHGWEVGPDGW